MASNQKNQKKSPHKFTFPAHQSHLLTLAKMCQDNQVSML